MKVTAWRRREGKIEIDGFSFMKFILFCFGTFSTMLFWIAFGMSVQWLIFFKRQKTVSQLLPSESQEKLFLTLLYVAFTFKLIDLIHMLVSQIFFDIFFVDWERPQGRVSQPTQGGEAGGMDAPVSIWRTLFIANEWNEIQTIRKINPELQIFLVLFFLKFVGFENLATTDPVSSTSVNYATDYVGEFSKVLRFAILSIVFLVIEALQWFFFAFIYERFVGDALGDFIDLCSMSNISIFILEVSAWQLHRDIYYCLQFQYLSDLKRDITRKSILIQVQSASSNAFKNNIAIFPDVRMAGWQLLPLSHTNVSKFDAFQHEISDSIFCVHHICCCYTVLYGTAAVSLSPQSTSLPDKI